MNIELDGPQLSAIIKLVEREHRTMTTILDDARERPTGNLDQLARYAYRRDGLAALADHLKGYRP